MAQDWTLVAPDGVPGTPPPRSWPGLAMDGVRGQAVLFGGYSAAGEWNDTWTFDAASAAWTQRAPATAPAARDSAGMAFDPWRRVVVLFGGVGSAVTPFADTWEWDGSNWAQVQPAGSAPPARQDLAMAWFPVHGRVLVHGGISHALNRAYADAWEWDGHAWTPVSAANGPFARSGHALAYDPVRGRLVLFGGITIAHAVMNDTWDYDGTTWTAGPTGPAGRRWHGLAFDSGLQQVVLYGGGTLLTRFADTWTYDGAWHARTPTTDAGARDSLRLCEDPVHGGVLLACGYTGADRADVWSFGPDAATWYAFGQGCAGSAGVPVLVPHGVPTAGNTFAVDVASLPPTGGLAAVALGLSTASWNGQPLPLPLAGFGLPGCTLQCSVDASTFAAHGNGTAHWSLAVPAAPNLLGLRFALQALSIDPAAGNALGGAVSAAGIGTIR